MSLLIKELKQVPNIVYREAGLQLSHAGASDFYVDIKKAYGYPAALNAVCDSLWKRIDPRTTVIATEGYGGNSPGAVLMTRHRLYHTLVRKDPKNHGKGGYLDGYLPTSNDYVTFIDDVWTTGGSLRKMIAKIVPTGAKVLGAHIVCRRGPGDLDDMNIPTTHEFTSDELMEALV